MAILIARTLLSSPSDAALVTSSPDNDLWSTDFMLPSFLTIAQNSPLTSPFPQPPDMVFLPIKWRGLLTRP